MDAIVFSSLVAANVAAGAITVALGYPKTSVDVGAGQHASSIASTTVDYTEPFKHPTQNQWALHVHAGDENIPALVSYMQAQGLTITSLDSTWFPDPTVNQVSMGG